MKWLDDENDDEENECFYYMKALSTNRALRAIRALSASRVLPANRAFPANSRSK